MAEQKRLLEGDWPKLSNPAERALHEAGIVRMEQLADYTAAELLALHGVGPKAIRILQPVMDARKIAFKKEE